MSGQAAIFDVAPPLSASRQGWIWSEAWDKRWIIFTALLAPVPVVFFLLCMHALTSYAGMARADAKGISEDLTSLFVMALAGGPHVWVTFTRTYLNANFKARHKFWYWAGFLVVPTVATLGLYSNTSRTLLMTGFFFLASLHIVHQLSYVVRFYHDRDGAKPSTASRWMDFGAVIFPLYPLSTFRMVMCNENSMARNWAASWFGSAAQAQEWKFHIGRMQPMLPDFILADWFWMANLAAFVFFTTLWGVKSYYEYRENRLHMPKFMLICCAIGVGLFAPCWPNLDSSFQGFNLWHSIQYIALTWFITRNMAARGEHTNGFMRWLGGEGQRGSRYYAFGLGVFFLIISIMLVIATVIVVSQGIGYFQGVGETTDAHYRPGAVLQSYYLLGFGLLLTHYFHDFFFFTRGTYLENAAAR